MTQKFGAIVIGAGGMGSAAAYYLSRAGIKVLLLEQFEIDHDRGSSHGISRIIRYAYDNPVYIELMRSAYPLWFAFEQEAGETLYVKTGGVEFGFPDEPSFQASIASMDAANLSYDRLSAHCLQKRYPQFCLSEGMEALFQADTGFLYASRCVLAHVRLARQRGTTVIDRSPVIEIIPSAEGVEVRTDKESFWGDRLVLTAGSWAKSLLRQQGLELPLEIMPCQLAFYRPENAERFIPGHFPIFFAHLKGDFGDFPYGIPHSDLNWGIKVTTFYGWPTVPSPADVDYTPSDRWVQQMQNVSHQYIPGVAGKLISTRRCLYTMTPDKHFIVDSHPDYSHIAIAAGFSGHGFKFTPLIGKILADLVTEGQTEHNLNLFQLSRFQS